MLAVESLPCAPKISSINTPLLLFGILSFICAFDFQKISLSYLELQTRSVSLEIFLRTWSMPLGCALNTQFSFILLSSIFFHGIVSIHLLSGCLFSHGRGLLSHVGDALVPLLQSKLRKARDGEDLIRKFHTFCLQ
jgi:ABC-type cobalamin transport system permease subunit